MQVSYCPSRQKYNVEGGTVILEEDEDDYSDDEEEEEEEEPNIVIAGGLDITDTDYKFYTDNFQNKAHYNLFAKVNNRGVILISAVRNNDDSYTVMIRTKEATRRLNLAENQVRVPWLRRVFGLGPSVRSIVRAIDNDLPVGRFKFSNHPDVPNDVMGFDQRQIIKGLKFGVLYRAAGQIHEEDMFSNEQSSPEFEKFLEFLGDRIELLNWDKFRAGLDVNTNTTGTHSIFCEYQNNQIMYHVSTLLPRSSEDMQQLERKRHIGNDIVVIVFQDANDVFRPQEITSRQIQVFIVVRPLIWNEKPSYEVTVVTKKGVPKFEPALPDPPILKAGKSFRRFIMEKLINAEKACYATPVIASKLEYSRNALLENIYDTYI